MSCSATTLSTTAVEEKRERIDVEKARVLVEEIQGVFNSGRTKSYEWRISQLNSISKMLNEKENDITAALYKDLSKPEIEAFVSEVHFLSLLLLLLLFVLISVVNHDRCFLCQKIVLVICIATT